MTEYRYTPIEGNVRCLGDSVDIDGTLNVDGVATHASTTTLTGATTPTGGFVSISGSHIKLVSAASGTNPGAVWTTGPPAFTTGQEYLLVTAGSTAFRIPVFRDA